MVQSRYETERKRTRKSRNRCNIVTTHLQPILNHRTSMVKVYIYYTLELDKFSNSHSYRLSIEEWMNFFVICGFRTHRFSNSCELFADCKPFRSLRFEHFIQNELCSAWNRQFPIVFSSFSKPCVNVCESQAIDAQTLRIDACRSLAASSAAAVMSTVMVVSSVVIVLNDISLPRARARIAVSSLWALSTYILWSFDNLYY